MNFRFPSLAGALASAGLMTACGGSAPDAAATLSGADTRTAASVHYPGAPPQDYRSQSLYQGPGPRPGPSLLYADPARAPQLENTGIWKAPPILVSGTSAYRRGEFLYQDYLYDDRGAKKLAEVLDVRYRKELFARSAGTYSYPDHPAYAGNAADIVELRVRTEPGYTAFRLTLNSLVDAEKVAFSIALGSSAETRPFPFGANARAPAQYFLTVHGAQAVLTDAQTGAVVLPAPSVGVDLERRQFQVSIPAEAWDPGRGIVRLAAAAGLWDSANQRYLLPAMLSSATRPGGTGLDLTPAAFFNVAFRFNETSEGGLGPALGESTWRDRAQAQALASGDLTPFHANVDFGKLADQVDDALAGQPQGVPAAGTINRIFASRVETKQGVDFGVLCGTEAGCLGEYRGQLQPYSLYIPTKAAPATGYGLSLLLHSLNANHNQYAGTSNQRLLGERGQGHLVATSLGRGADGWFLDHAESDIFEMWADIARHYRLNPAMSSVSGYSMGGHGTFRLATRYPDLFAGAHVSAAGPTFGYWFPPMAPASGDATNMANMLPNLRHLPFMIWTQQLDEGLSPPGVHEAQKRLAQLGYRHRVDTFPLAEHLTLYLHDNYTDSAAFLGDAVLDRDPAHVSFVANPSMDFPALGLVSNHAFWVSDVAVRNMAALPRGTVEAVSRAFGSADALAFPLHTTLGALPGKLVLQPYVSETMSWAQPVAAPALDKLELSLRNVSRVAVNMQRARLSCNAAIDVDSDGPVTVVLDGCNRSEQH